MKKYLEEQLSCLLPCRFLRTYEGKKIFVIQFYKPEADERGSLEIDDIISLNVTALARITNDVEILLAQIDIHEPGEGVDEEAFEKGVEENSIFTQKAESVTKLLSKKKVEQISVDNYGGFVIKIEGGYHIEVFVGSSSQLESWRLIDIETDKHFVFEGIETKPIWE